MWFVGCMDRWSDGRRLTEAGMRLARERQSAYPHALHNAIDQLPTPAADTIKPHQQVKLRARYLAAFDVCGNCRPVPVCDTLVWLAPRRLSIPRCSLG